MEKPKRKVVKSKSSNSAITTKSDNKDNKKSKSNAEFQPHVLKKRGVYVAKKSTRSPSNDKNGLKAPPRPRAGKKRFLTSAFEILSKYTTAGTQYPEIEDSQKKEKKGKSKKKKEETVVEIRQPPPKRKQRYRSKYLHEFRNDNNQQLVILQSKKDLIQTSSNYSSSGKEQESIKRLNLPRLVKADIYSNESSKALKSKLYENIPIAQEIIDGINFQENEVALFNKEPKSLVADTKENGLYSFFVDLLETTFSVYNVKAQFNSVPVNSDLSISKVEFEIDENVAKKLNVTNSPCPSPEMFDDVTQKPSGNYFYVTHENFWTDKKPDDHFNPPVDKKYSKPEPVNTAIRNRKLKTNSFVYNRPPPTVAENAISPKKSFSRKNRKKYLMCLLKQQLQMDDDVYEEPQNFYQALRVIARNKRRLKEITFSEPKRRATNNIDYRDHECMFKRRSLISPRAKSKKYKPKSEFIQSMRSVAREYSEVSSFSRNRPIKPESLLDDNESNHSVEVYGYDYENNSLSKKPVYEPQKEIIFTYHTSSSESGDEFNSDEAILNYYGDSQEKVR